MKKSITLKELSKILGVSISTISKALNDSPEISHDTKTKVKELAALHKYQPNVLARNLKSGTTKTIAVVLPTVQNNFFTEVLLGIETEIEKTDYNIIISITNESFKKESKSVNNLSNGIVDGFIISTSEETQIEEDFNHLTSAIDNNKPIAMFDRVIKTIECDKVLEDNREAVYKATKYLLESGKKHIAISSTINNITVGKSRTNGYKKALEEFGITVNEADIVTGSQESIKNEVSKYLINNKPDAFIGLDEDGTLSALKAVKEKNYKIPEEVAVIGYANQNIAPHLTPELTTIDQNGIEIGKTIVRLLINRLKNPTKPFEKVVLPSILCKRLSS